MSRTAGALEAGALHSPQLAELRVQRPVVASLSDQAYRWLKEQIFIGVLEPGQRLKVDELAREIGVSRTPVRDAIIELARDGLIVVHPRRGTVVAALTVQDIEDAYDARLLVEPVISGAAARRSRPGQWDTLEAIQLEAEQIDSASVYADFSAHSRYSELDAAFHVGIAATLGNPRLTELLGDVNIQRRIAPLVFGTDYRGPEGRIAEHRAILSALVDGDGGTTKTVVRRHIASAHRELVQFVSRRADDRGAITQLGGAPRKGG